MMKLKAEPALRISRIGIPNYMNPNYGQKLSWIALRWIVLGSIRWISTSARADSGLDPRTSRPGTRPLPAVLGAKQRAIIDTAIRPHMDTITRGSDNQAIRRHANYSVFSGSLGSWFQDTNVGLKFLVSLRFKILLHFFDRFSLRQS